MALGAKAEQASVTTTVTALDAYNDGYARNVMRAPGGVVLNDLVLIEDDAPGSGCSQRGSHVEPVHQGVLVRKTLNLNNPAAEDAHVVLFMDRFNRPATEPAPSFYLIVNGHRIEGGGKPSHEGNWRWVKIPTSWLRRGKNEVVLGCDAPAGKGYNLLTSREDEYANGGGAYTYEGNTALIGARQLEIAKLQEAGDKKLLPIKVGENSAKSLDGGKHWIKGRLGMKGNIVGEYCIRLNLKQRQAGGTLRSGAIDLWDGVRGMETLKPRCTVRELEMAGTGQTPGETQIEWFIRFADTADLNAGEWGAFQRLGTGSQVQYKLNAAGKRYCQWQAVLKTRSPLATPIVEQVRIGRKLSFTPLTANSFYVTACENVRQRYGSYLFGYEDSQHPKLQALRQRLKLDQVVAGCNGDFERINRLRHYVSGLWFHGLPIPDYPEWDAGQILDRRDRLGWGGMCIQFAITYMQALQAYGYTARHVNVFAHETVEVYCDELGKWIHEDPESLFDSYEHETEGGMPLNSLEQHGYMLKAFGLSAKNPMDWMNPKPWDWPGPQVKVKSQPLRICTATDWINDPKALPPQHRLVGFMRIIPRNDFLSHPTPRPVNHGLWYTWPWDGYLNWYDPATPRKLQYALHSDREADFYPTLNRVQFSATQGEKEGDWEIAMITFTPNFERFEVNLDEGGWQTSPARFTWQLHRNAMNTLRMRTVNKAGRSGKESRLQVLWNYCEPFRPSPPHKPNGPMELGDWRF